MHSFVPGQELHTAQEEAAGYPKRSAPFSAIVILYLDFWRAVPAAQTPPYLRLEAALFFPEQSKPSTNRLSASNPDEPASWTAAGSDANCLPSLNPAKPVRAPFSHVRSSSAFHAALARGAVDE